MTVGISICRLYRPGVVDYESAWHMQEQLAGDVARGAAPVLILLEHPHTYTLGRRGKDENLLWDQEEISNRNVRVFHVDRGGDITYHGPGQLVGYPILRLAEPGWQGDSGRLPQADFVGYIRRLEDLIIRALGRLGLPAEARPGLSGVWINEEVIAGHIHRDARPGLSSLSPGKIASIGVKVDVNGITRHGFALNVAPDMTYWEGIVPCGLDGVQMVSLADFFEQPPSMDVVMKEIERAFEAVFKMELNPSPNPL